MSLSKKINRCTLSLRKCDITDFEVEAFVYYARSDLKLGAGYGNAIAVRGGPTIQKELDQIGGALVGEAIITSAGNMKAKYIIHAVGPKFQEEQTAPKLKETILNSLRQAEARGIKQIAFPPMGAGFYCIPLPLCADVMVDTIKGHLDAQSGIDEIIICALDNREYEPFRAKLETLP